MIAEKAQWHGAYYRNRLVCVCVHMQVFLKTLFAVLKLSKIMTILATLSQNERVLLCFIYNVLFRKAGQCVLYQNIYTKISVLMLKTICCLANYLLYF